MHRRFPFLSVVPKYRVRPTLGAWMTYGLGVESDNLPGFVVMTSVSKGTRAADRFSMTFTGVRDSCPLAFKESNSGRGHSRCFYPSSDPAGMTRGLKRGLLDDIAQVNRLEVVAAKW